MLPAGFGNGTRGRSALEQKMTNPPKRASHQPAQRVHKCSHHPKCSSQLNLMLTEFSNGWLRREGGGGCLLHDKVCGRSTTLSFTFANHRTDRQRAGVGGGVYKSDRKLIGLTKHSRPALLLLRTVRPFTLVACTNPLRSLLTCLSLAMASDDMKSPRCNFVTKHMTWY